MKSFLQRYVGLQLAILLFLGFIWGSSFILMKKGLMLFTDMEVAAIRLIGAGLALLPFALKHLSSVSRKEFLYIAISGIVGSGIPAFLFTYAETYISSTEASIYNSLTPVFTLLFAVVFFKTAVHKVNIAGVVLGLVGAVFLTLQRNNGNISFSSHPGYGLLLVLATFMYGFNSNHIKNNLVKTNSMAITSIAFFVLIFPSIPFLLNNSFIQKIHNPLFLPSFLYTITLAIVGTAFAQTVWNKFIKNNTTIYASAVTYIIPVFALMWGLLDHETLCINHAIAILCIFAGIFLVNYKSKNAA